MQGWREALSDRAAGDSSCVQEKAQRQSGIGIRRDAGEGSRLGRSRCHPWWHRHAGGGGCSRSYWWGGSCRGGNGAGGHHSGGVDKGETKGGGQG